MKIRALGLVSGGLDSALAAKLLLEQGLEVVGFHLRSPTACRSDVGALAAELGIPLEVRDKGEEYVKVLREPRFGYGRNMNPCLDCRVFMFHRAQDYLKETGAQFLFTGEVVGQRPMSQRRSSITLIDREAGLEGRVLRPLSARLLPETEPERLGWVDRSRLLDIAGRTRTRQLELARGWGLSAYASPGGGCLLTDPGFAPRVRELFDHVPAGENRMLDLELLRIGRHFYEDGFRVVLGRDADENRRLVAFAGPGRWLVEPDGFGGPTALVCGERTETRLARAAELILRHSRRIEAEDSLRWRDGEELGAIPACAPAFGTERRPA